MRALSLPGCACRGAFQFAVMKRLTDAGEQFDLVAGASSGSICGAIVTAGLASSGPDMWRSFMSTKVVSARYLRSEGSVFGMSRILREGLEKFVPLSAIQASDTELLVATTRARAFAQEAFGPVLDIAKGAVAKFKSELVATNAPTAEHGARHLGVRAALRKQMDALAKRMPNSLVVHSSRERTDLHDIIAASCFIPVVYAKTIVIDGELHVDGGAADNTLIEELIRRGADDITMITPYVEGRVASTIFAKERRPTVPPHVRLRILCPERALSQKRFDFAKEPMEEALNMPHREILIERGERH